VRHPRRMRRGHRGSRRLLAGEAPRLVALCPRRPGKRRRPCERRRSAHPGRPALAGASWGSAPRAAAAPAGRACSGTVRATRHYAHLGPFGVGGDHAGKRPASFCPSPRVRPPCWQGTASLEAGAGRRCARRPRGPSAFGKPAWPRRPLQVVQGGAGRRAAVVEVGVDKLFSRRLRWRASACTACRPSGAGRPSWSSPAATSRWCSPTRT